MAPAGAGTRTLVMKFGGTSVGSPEAMAQVARLVARYREEWPRLVVVTSALAGVTDTLLKAARTAAQGATDSIWAARRKLEAKHRAIVRELLPQGENDPIWYLIQNRLDSFTRLAEAMAVLGEATPRGLDAIAALGERMSAPLLARVLEVQGLPAVAVDAGRLIVTDDHFQAAHPLAEPSREQVHRHLLPLLEAGRIPVVTGFIGATAQGVTTTLGRGGSDYSASLIAALLPADEVWIWTDVNGVMTADPRLVPQARTVPRLSYREVAELAYFGAKVLHPKTIRPVVEAGIPLRVRNTFDPDGPDTLILQHRDAVPGRIMALTVIQNLAMVIVEGRGMLGVPGVAARTFTAVAQTHTSVLMISQASSEQSICFIIPQETASRVQAALEEAFQRELQRRDIDRIWVQPRVAIITAVGEGLRNTPGVAGRIFGALGRVGVNILAIAQGASEVALSLTVNQDDVVRALQALHPLALESFSDPVPQGSHSTPQEVGS